MSLYLPEQKLGSHSNTDSSSHKFMLKGRQTGGMHRGHGWVFRAESYDTMMAWYEDIKSLTEKTGEERNAFVRRHARSVSAGSHTAGSISSEGALEEDEADQVPYSANVSQIDQTSPVHAKLPERPQPGGRFPSDINTSRDLQAPLSPSSSTCSDDRDVIAAAAALPSSDAHHGGFEQQTHKQEQHAHFSRAEDDATRSASKPHMSQPQQNNTLQSQPVSNSTSSQANAIALHGEEYNRQPMHSQDISSEFPGPVAYGTSSQIQSRQAPREFPQQPQRNNSTYGEWMAPVAAGERGTLTGASNDELLHREQRAIPSSTQHQDSKLNLIAPSRQDSIEVQPNEPNQLSNTPKEINTNSPISFPNAEPSLTSPISSGTSQATGLTAPNTQPVFANDSADLKRPSLPNHKSVQTISDLHVPGEFPRSSTPKSVIQGLRNDKF